MPRLIADLNLNSERGREAGRTGETEEERRGKKRWGRKEGGDGRAHADTLRQRNLFMKNVALIQEEVKKKRQRVSKWW